MIIKQTINSFSAWTVDRLTSAWRATLTMLATFLIAMTAQTAWAWSGSGTSSEPYQISSTTDLNQLAADVNSGTTYENTYFIVTANIAYNPNVLIIDNNGDSHADSNFTAIGGQATDLRNIFFKGHFDGNGKTISGIRIYKNGNSNGFTDLCQGLFGMIEGGEVKNVILTNANITGNDYCAGIVGWNNGGTISNCIVTNSVSINSNNTNVRCHGGIAGSNDSGIISGCVSSAQLTVSGSGASEFGGIAGTNYNGVTLRDNLVIGATIPAVSGGYYGAITGLSGNESCNYYINCTVAGTANATNVGVGGTSSPSDADGARQALTVAIPTNGIPSGTATEYNVSGITGYTGKSGGSSTTENNIILYDNGTTSTYYSGAGETVTFLYNYDGYQVSVTDADGKVDFTKDIIQTSETNIYHNHTFTMPAKAVTITATDVWGVAGGKDGSTDNKAYTITSTAGLDLLAQNVNAGRLYINMYFKLGANITYDPTVLTIDNDGDSNADSNFTPIGIDGYHPFCGTFDGNGKTISGININNSTAEYLGVFGLLYGTVENLVVSSCSIVACQNVGAIAGYLGTATIENCSVSNNVTLSGNSYVGGIAGWCADATIKGCVSAAAITGIKIPGINTFCLGGIAGAALSDSKVIDNLFTGTINGELEEFIGAIVGENPNGGLDNNLYTSAGFGGIGAEGSATGSDGAGARKAYTVTLSDGVAPSGTPSVYDVSGITVYADNNIIRYNSTYYAAADQSVKLSYSGVVAEGCGVGYKVNDGEATAGNTITMPAENATITKVDMALWGNGDGSETKPYTITTTAGLDLLAEKVNAGSKYRNTYFKLGADIEYNKNTANNFTPIGNNNNYFYGTFDGQGHTISGIRINKPTADYLGVFGFLYGTVKNLVVSDCSIVARSSVGAIAGYLGTATIENCSASNNVILSGYLYVGGIAGASNQGTIKGCVSAATITGITSSGSNAENLGGIVGATIDNPSSLTDNLFTGVITGDLKEYIGAIVGQNANGGLDNNLYTSTGLGGRGIASGSEKSTTGADGAGAHKAVEIIAAEGVTITPTGTKTTYNVSGITAYTDNNFIGYDSKLYAGATTRATFSIDYTEPEGYMFEGFDAGEGVGIVLNEGVYNLAVPASNVTVKVVYKAIEYKLTYNLAGGALAEGVSNPTTYTVESDAITLKNPTREGYAFEGWTGTGLTEATTTVTIAKGSTGDRAYTATWSLADYTITYDLAGGALAEGVSNPAGYNIDSDDITLNNPTREGYTFAGWTGTGLTEATITVTIAKGSHENKTYTATWEKNPDTRYEVDDDGVAVTTMAYLAELALDDTMEDYVKDGKLKATVTPKNKYWTLACGVDLLLPKGVVVYKARMNSTGTKVELTEIDATTLGGVLKANNGVLIASTPGQSYDLVVSPNNSVTTLSNADAKSYGTDNELEPVLEDTHFTTEDYFILTENKFIMVDISKDTKVPAGKAVLKVAAGSAKTRTLDVIDGETTGIASVVKSGEEEVWYNLQGQRISKPTRKGVYILNGKKVRK